jgi:hypothetical protein
LNLSPTAGYYLVPTPSTTHVFVEANIQNMKRGGVEGEKMSNVNVIDMGDVVIPRI